MSDAPPDRRGAEAPDASAVNVRAMPSVLGRIARLTLRYPGQVSLTLVITLLSALAALSVPRLLGGAVDQAHYLLAQGGTLAEPARRALLLSAVLVVAATTLRGVLSAVSAHLGEHLSQRVAYDLRLAFFQQLQRLSFGFHDRAHSGDLITRGMLDLEGARSFIQGAMLQAISLSLLVGFSTWMMVTADPALALVGLAFVPLAGVVLARVGFRLRITWLRVQELMSRLTLTMEENLQGTRVVRAFAGKPFELGKFDQASGDVLQTQYKRITLRFSGVTWMMLCFHVSLGLLLLLGGQKVMAGQMSVGRLTEFLTYMTLLQSPIRHVSMIFNTMARATSAGARLFEVLDVEPEIADAPGAERLRLREGVLRFEHVDFGYVPGRPVLTDVSFEVRPGRTLGIVGAPGSGKSTIANLVPRFYDVGGGRITIDGVDIRTVTLASLREHIGLIQQEAFLFDASVGHNVAYADPWAEDDRIEDAARTAQIHDHVAGLALTYGTRVGERGVALSGGQRQRLSIARGVLPGPGVMIFDDSTAAVDAVTERRVRDALARATQRKATIIIAHRLSSLMHADEIIVLDEGRIVERGRHAELVARGGIYADLYELQTRADAGALDEAPAPAAAAL